MLTNITHQSNSNILTETEKQESETEETHNPGTVAWSRSCKYSGDSVVIYGPLSFYDL